MKSKMLLVVVCIILICVILPTGTASADDTEAWVLVETYFSPPEKNKEWEQTFLDVVTFNKIILTETEFSYRQRVEKAGNTTVDASFQFSFDTPPEELVPGETVRLSITGLSSGKGNVLEKTFGLNVKEWIDDQPNNQTYTQLDRKVTGVIKSSVAEVRTKLEGTAAEDKQTLEFIVPEIIDGKLIITTSNNITADVGISWTYEPGESKSSPEESEKAGTPVFSQEEFDKMKASVARLAPYAPPWMGNLLKEGYIGMVEAAMGDSTINDYTGRQMRTPRPRQVGTKLYDVQYIRIGDTIQTGKDGRLKIMLFDRGPLIYRPGMTVINVAPNSELTWTSFRGFLEQDPDQDGSYISLIKGMIRKYVGKGEAALSIRTGVTICGIRGSDVLISYDPSIERVDAYVIEGHMDVTNSETGVTKSLTENQKLVVTGGNIGEIQFLSQGEWDSLVKDNGIEDVQGLSQEQLEQLVKASSSSPPWILIGMVTAVVVFLALFVIRKRLKKACILPNHLK